VRERLLQLPSVSALVNVWPFLRPEWRWLVLVAAVTLVLTAVELAVPILVGLFVDSLLSQLSGRAPATPPALDQKTIIGLLAGAALLRGFLVFQQRALAGRVGQEVAARMRDTLWAHLQTLPLSYVQRRGPGRLLVRFISDARAVQRLVSRGIVQLVQDALVVAGVLAVLVYLNRNMGLAAAGVVPAVGALFWYLNPRLQDASRKMRRRRTRLSAHLNGRISGLEVLKSYGRQGEEERRVRKLNRRVVEHGIRRERAGGMLLGASAGLVALVTAGVLGLAAGEVAAGRLTAGQLVTFYALLGLLAPIFQRITTADRTLQEAEISIRRLTETLKQEPESPVDGELPPLEVSGGEVSFEDVSFTYPDGTRALEGVSLKARRGELVAVVGPNGAGKSTLLQLLPRFLQPTAGRVLIDGQDTGEVSLASLRAQVGFVSLDTPLFDGTISENIAYGAEGEVPEERVRHAACLAGVDDFVDALPDGWETKLREGRRTLSYGQRQRVALARALVSDPPILVLDQAAAAVDADTYRALVEKLRELAREKTVIVATHRLSALLVSDRIYTLEEGRVVEQSDEFSPELHGDEGVMFLLKDLAEVDRREEKDREPSGR
jgi:subfamily B ATP-binding cassette protein MsbA